MNLTHLQCQLHDSDQRRIELINLLLSFQHWYQNSGLIIPEADALVTTAIERLGKCSFTLACVGEFSRGKSELINALLFDPFRCRVLPSQPGRTTMCPTEIGYSPSLPVNSIQLLPISTRKGGISVRSFKRIPKHWVNLSFDINNPGSLQDALGRLAERQYVSEEYARDLGFNCSQLNRHPQNIHEVEVPVWRYAHVNLEHPLLAQGLRIIDLPGLNALGTEPELTLQSLSNIDNLVFFLAADSPVSATDKSLWRDLVSGEENSHPLVILNKIDSLWDDLISAPSEEATVNNVRTETALALGLPLQQVVPLSAKKALLAKARADKALLAKSNFQQFEAMLTAQMNDRLKQLFKHPEIEDALTLLRQTYDHMHERMLAQVQLVQGAQGVLDSAPGNVVVYLQRERDSLKEEHRRVHQVSLINRSFERQVKLQHQALMAVFNQKQTDRLLNYLNTAATDPEPILRPAIKATLKQMQLCLRKLSIEAQSANQLLVKIYAESEGNGTLRLSSRKLDISSRQRVYFELKNRCERFLNSLEHGAASDRRLIRHFLLDVSQEVRLFVDDTNGLIESWFRHALTPLNYPNECVKQLLQRELLGLSRVASASGEQAVIAGLRTELSSIEENLYVLNQLLQRQDSVESAKPITDKVVPLSFARRKSS